jgi:hypothetical protein
MVVLGLLAVAYGLARVDQRRRRARAAEAVRTSRWRVTCYPAGDDETQVCLLRGEGGACILVGTVPNAAPDYTMRLEGLKAEARERALTLNDEENG